MISVSMPSAINRLDAAFARLKAKNEGALVCFVVAGDPFTAVSGMADAIVSIAEAGADIIEIGIPYSDPLADGKSIQAASQRALDSGVTPDFVFDVVRAVRMKSDVPLVLMTYYNPVLIYGHSKFAKQMRSAGADGIIITDLPPEEADDWKTAADAAGIATLFLLAPTSTEKRLASVTAHMNSGFVYCVSRTGVTGRQQEVPAELSRLLSAIRNKTDLPLCVGFGVSTAAHVATIVSFSDGAVIGSALVDFLAHNSVNSDWKEQTINLIAEWKSATRRVKS
jgi:tryptophan synthase alpha chain